jgi:excisionase family DNA binding protein
MGGESLTDLEPAKKAERVSNEAKTQTIEEAAKELGIGRNQAYAAAKRGEIPTLRIGKRILVLKEPLKRMLAGSL